MNYPDDFEIPTFPAGRSMAISRAVAIGTMTAFLLILFLCIVLLWAMRSGRIHPFLVSVDNSTGLWQVVGHDHGKKTLTAANALQESAVAHFVQNWFTLSDVAAENDAVWKTCERVSECMGTSNAPYGDKTCALYCAAGDDIFSRFIYDVVPDYQMRVAMGERWVVDMDTINISAVDKASDNGGTWRVIATVRSNMSAPMEIIAFAKVARNLKTYPRTMGFYVADFNAYKIN